MEMNSQKCNHISLGYASSVATTNFDAGMQCWFYSLPPEKVLLLTLISLSSLTSAGMKN